MIKSPYNYTVLSRYTTPEGRKYNSPDGPLPSVTTILDATKSKESKQALLEWKKRIGEKKAQEITKEAAGRGTKMHSYLENYVINGVLKQPGSHPMSIKSYAMATQIVKKGLSKCDEYWGVEISLYFPKIYAGTTDLIGVHEGEPAIIDFKQTNKPKKHEWIEDYFYQLAAYAAAHNELYGTNIRKGVVMMCSVDEEYQEFIIQGNEFDEWVNKWFYKLEEYYSKFV
jgi:genome maintenance exonuclease 1